MSKHKLILMIVLVSQITSFAQDLQITQCSFDRKDDTLQIKLYITNKSNRALYIPLQYWEVELIGHGNRILVYPYEKYPVNRIYIYSKEFNTIKSTGSKCCYPKYKELPYFSKIQPDSTTNILISILSQKDLIDSVDYKSELILNYYYEELLKSQIKGFNRQKKMFLVNNKKVSVLLFDGITNLKEKKSTVKCKEGILIDQYLELRAVCE